MQDNTLAVNAPRENTPAHWMKQLDRLLRGEATRLSSLRQGIIDVSPEGMTILILAWAQFTDCAWAVTRCFSPEARRWRKRCQP
jgi:hypothetical protein